MSFISEDKKIITLPVALGTTVYRYHTSCNDACMFQKEKFDIVFPKNKEGRCSKSMPCHTKLHSVQPVKVQLSNLDLILEGWGVIIFKTEYEAREAGVKTIEMHKQQLLDLGLSVE